MNIIHIKTKEAYSVKVLVELLNKYIKDGCIEVHKDGLRCNGQDQKTVRGTKLIGFDLPKSNFTKYKSPDTPVYLGLNMVHFYRLLKSIKKKDTLILSIRKDDPLTLIIQIHQNGEDESMAITKTLKITNVRPTTYDKITGYGDPIIATAKEFQKLKTLNKISKTMEVTSSKGRIVFLCDKEGVYKSDVPFGDIDSDDENESKNEEEDTYEQTFDSDQIIDLVKMGGMSNTIKIYVHQDLPLHFMLSAGPLGNVWVYLKSKQDIEAENEDDETVVVNKEDGERII